MCLLYETRIVLSTTFATDIGIWLDFPRMGATGASALMLEIPITHPSELPNAATSVKPPGLRLTPQRRRVYDVLLAQRDHPTVQEVHQRAKARLPKISLATVYNCLEALTQFGFVKQVNLDRSPSRYCPNLHDHAHFHCDSCGKVTDIALHVEPSAVLPEGAVLRRLDVNLRGICSQCATLP